MKKLLFLIFLSIWVISCVEAALVSTAYQGYDNATNIKRTQLCIIKTHRGLALKEYWENENTPDGMNNVYHLKVSGIIKGTEAEKANIKSGDEIKKINGDNIWTETIYNAFFSGDDKPFTLTIKRGSMEYQTSMNPI